MTRLLSTATDMFEVRKLLDRRAFLTEEGDDGVGAKVREILKNVRERGNDALIEYTMRFDKVALSVSDLRVTEYEIAGGKKGLPRVYGGLAPGQKEYRKLSPAAAGPILGDF